MNYDNNQGSDGCGSNTTPYITWDVVYTGSANDSNTTFDITIEDIDNANSLHWSGSLIPGAVREINHTLGLSNGQAGTSDYPELQNVWGYAGPFPGFNIADIHTYRITITPVSSNGSTTISSFIDRNNTACEFVVNQTDTVDTALRSVFVKWEP